jgi:hypothetical protein
MARFLKGSGRAPFAWVRVRVSDLPSCILQYLVDDEPGGGFAQRHFLGGWVGPFCKILDLSGTGWLSSKGFSVANVCCRTPHGCKE